MSDSIFEMTKQTHEKYLLIDISNHMHRCRHGAIKGGGDNEYAMHLAITALAKLVREIKPTKIVAAIDHGSWRKKVYPPYKARRHESRKDDATFPAFLECVAEFVELIREYSTIICLEHKDVEADDWIARWVQTHKQDDHVVCSSDGDFHQLHASNVTQYNPVSKKWVDVEDPAFAIFVKCIRGEQGASSDNIFSAFPRVRLDRLRTAFYEDKFDLENMMQHKVPDFAFPDKDGEPKLVTVRHLFERNEGLMNLTKQPSEIIKNMDDLIETISTGKFNVFKVLTYLGNKELFVLGNSIDSWKGMFKL